MSQKRQPPPEERLAGSGSGDSGSSPEEKRQRVPALRGIFMDVLRTDAVKRLLSALEPLVRRVVKEEVELALANHLASVSRECGKQDTPACTRNLQLQFLNKLSLPMFTGTRIEGEESSCINVAVVDTLTGERVASEPETSLKVEIVVLEGDFEGNEQESWTYEEFKSNIVKERYGKRSLLTGDVFVDLIDGIGAIGELSFTDNSSWTRSRKFRLGAKTVDGYVNGVRVREARTEAFMVKDHRGELYKKHYPPLLSDDVWRLEKIGKDGAFHKRLSSENINTVKDFLTLLVTDAPKLRNILGGGMSARMWEMTVDHARTCTLTSQLHLYYADNLQKIGVVFDVIAELIGITTDQKFVSVNDLSDAQKVGILLHFPSASPPDSHEHIYQADAKMLVKQAIQDRDNVLAFDIGGVMGVSSQPFSCPLPPASQPLPGDIYSSYSSPVKVDDGGFNFSYSAISSPDIFARGLDVFSHQPEPHGVLPSCPELEKISDPQAYFGESLQFFSPDMSFLSQTLGIDSEADLGSAMAGFITTSHWSPYAVWGILLLVLKWRFYIKKRVATKKRAPTEREARMRNFMEEVSKTV